MERFAVGMPERASELDLTAMLDAVEDAVFRCDARSGRVLAANRAGRRLLGAERIGEMSISDWSALDEGYGAPRALPALQRAAAGSSERLAWRSQRADGSRFWSELQLSRAPTTPSEPARVIVVLRDTTAERRAADALGAAEERYRGLVQSLPHSAILLCDHELRLLLVDGPEVEATGFSKAEMEGKTIFEALPADFAQLVAGNLQRVLAGESFSAELPFRDLWYAYHYLPIRDGAGAVLYGMILALNITEQYRAREALRRSEELFAKIVQNAPDPMTILRASDNVITYVNAAFELTFGWASSEAVGKTGLDLNLWGDPAQREQVLEQFRRDRRVDSRPVQIRRRDGVQLEGLLSVRPIEIDGVRGMLSSFRDVSELARARAELATSEARLRALVDAAFEGIGIAHQGQVVDANEQLAAMYGTTREGLIGRPVMSLAAPESRELVRSRVEQRLEGAYEHVAQRLDGSTFLVEVRSRSVVLGGRTLRISAIRDVTDRKRAEAERERMITELTARNAEMEQFTYTVSHDLKSPLVTINGFLGALERDLSEGNSTRVQADLNRIRSATTKMSSLLDNLLELSRVGRIGGAFTPVAMTAAARDAEELVSGSLGNGSLGNGSLGNGSLGRGRVQLVISPDLPVVRGDRARLVQVLQNLFENAAKYMGDQPQPRVELSAIREAEHYVFSVRDNGIGVDPKYAERIFGLFEKLDPRSAGTGIGLALVRRIIEFHGGRVWVESDGRNGSTFRFRLPRPEYAPASREGSVPEHQPREGTSKP